MEEKENERASGVDDGGVWYSTLSTRQKNPKKPPKNFSCSFKLFLCEKKEDPRKDVVVPLQSDKLANRSKAFKMSFEQCRFGLRAVK